MKKYQKIITILFSTLILVISCIIIFFYLSPKNPQSFNNYSNNMLITSSAFSSRDQIPDQHGCHGEDINPPLTFQDVPQEAKSLVLLVDDPDAPSGDWVHWLVFNIDPKTTTINEHSTPEGAIVGLNSFGENTYEGPCPPNGTHHYNFKLYAIDKVLDLTPKAEKPDVLNAIKGHIIAEALLIGTYSCQ